MSNRPEHKFQGTGKLCSDCGLAFSKHRVRFRERKEHVFKGGGQRCEECGLGRDKHYERDERPEHKFQGAGVICSVCGLGYNRHRLRGKRRIDKRVEHPFNGEKGKPCGRCGLLAHMHRNRASGSIRHPPKEKALPFYVGIDGEGQGRDNHKYVLLAAARASGVGWHVENPNGLSTKTCLDMILSLPAEARIFAYAFNYDLTMMLRDLPNEHLYYLFRPDLRQRPQKFAALGPRPIFWEGYSLNLQGTKFTVSYRGKRRVIWDIWKFFQASFVKTLKNWNIGQDDLSAIAAMKAQRGEFDKLTLDEIRPYCFAECKNLAILAKKLVDAHTDAGLELRAFYGAGSTGSAILKQMGVKRCIQPTPDELRRIVAMSFFGGRFENSRIGLVKAPVYSYDISSAYPYQEYFLPCLTHAKWEHITSRNQLVIMTKGSALVRYRLRTPSKKFRWGPFPFRTAEGSICFPESSGGGWVWLDEYLAGESMFPNVEFLEAWVLHCECDCHPFSKMPHYYRERVRIGKEGAGWVFKLGPNASYGKTAQSVGEGEFTCWEWASMTTSNTRGQLLRLMAAHSDLDNILMLATDGAHSLESIETEKPRDTGTGHLPKPLGGWECKEPITGGVFYARPGVYFPADHGWHPPLVKEGDEESARARGLGRGTLQREKINIMHAWEQVEDVSAKVVIGQVVRFIGAKSSISVRERDLYVRSLDYGQWKPRDIELTFSPLPKRDGGIFRTSSETRNEGMRLLTRRFDEDVESRPYARALGLPKQIPEETRTSIFQENELAEQPDLHLGGY